MRGWQVALVALAAALFVPATHAEEVLPWSLPECAMALAYVQADPARVAPYLPDGFEPWISGPQRHAAVLVEFADCGDSSYGNWEIIVEKPAGRGDEEVYGYYVKHDTLVLDPFTRHALAAWGLPVHDGAARIEDGTVPGSFVATLTFDGVGTFEMTFTLAGEAPEPYDFPFLEFTPVPGGDVITWDARLDALALGDGAGVLEVPPGSALADIAGSETIVVAAQAGGWDGLGGAVRSPASVPEVAPPDARFPVAVAFVSGAAGAGIAWRLVRVFGGYSRFASDEAAEHPRRQRLLSLVRERPGITPSELREATGFAPGVLAHHLRLLEQHQHIERRREGLRTRVYLAGAPSTPWLPPARARLLDAIRAAPGSSQRELAAALGVTRWAVAHHARALVRDGLAREERVGRERRYRESGAREPGGGAGGGSGE